LPEAGALLFAALCVITVPMGIEMRSAASNPRRTVWSYSSSRQVLNFNIVSVYEHDAYDDFVLWAKDHNSPKEALASINELETGLDARYLEDPSWNKIVYWV